MSDAPLLTIRLKKRHIIATLLILISLLFAYSFYFKTFMTLPQSAINIIPEATFDLTNKKIIIFSPHCDDETLGTFGVIERAVASGSQVKVVMVTDCNHHQDGQTRKNETISAMKLAGLQANNIDFWDFAEAQDRSSSETAELRGDISRELDSFQPDWVFTPNPQDTHKDHKFTGQNVEKVLQDKGESSRAVYYLIHYNFLKFPSPPGFRPESYIVPPARLIDFNNRWYKFDLTADEENHKEEAVYKYKSQLIFSNPVLKRVLYDFIRRNELFMVRHNSVQ